MDATGSGPELGSRGGGPDDRSDSQNRLRVPADFLPGLHLKTEEPLRLSLKSQNFLPPDSPPAGLVLAVAWVRNTD